MIWTKKWAMNSLLSSRLYDNNTFYKAFEKDLMSARQTVFIESPFITMKRLATLMPILRILRRKGICIFINTRSPDEYDLEHALQATFAITSIQNIGVTVLYTGKLHRKIAIIDNRILWEGSLNILSQNDSCEIMRRSVSMQIAGEMMNFIRLSQWLTQSNR